MLSWAVGQGYPSEYRCAGSRGALNQQAAPGSFDSFLHQLQTEVARRVYAAHVESTAVIPDTQFRETILGLSKLNLDQLGA